MSTESKREALAATMIERRAQVRELFRLTGKDYAATVQEYIDLLQKHAKSGGVTTMQAGRELCMEIGRDGKNFPLPSLTIGLIVAAMVEISEERSREKVTH